MIHQANKNRARIVLFLLSLCLIAPRAKSQVLFENDSLAGCNVIDIVNVALSADMQKEYKQKDIATSVIVGYNSHKNKVEFYWLNDRYDFDLHSIQRGDSIILHYPRTSRYPHNKNLAIAIDNHSFEERIRKNDSIYIDVDFFDVDQKAKLPPSLDEGLFLKWAVAKRRFMEHIIEDSRGLRTLGIENTNDLRLSERTFAQLYCIYILIHNETIRNKE